MALERFPSLVTDEAEGGSAVKLRIETGLGERQGSFEGPTTRFEMKYRGVGLPLYEVTAALGPRNATERLRLIKAMMELTALNES